MRCKKCKEVDDWWNKQSGSHMIENGEWKATWERMPINLIKHHANCKIGENFFISKQAQRIFQSVYVKRCTKLGRILNEKS